MLPAFRRLSPGVLLVMCLAVATTACGSSHAPVLRAVLLNAKAVVDPLAGQSTGSILLHAAAGTMAAPAVHMTGKAADSGHTVTFSVSVGSHACTGTMSESNEGSVQLVSDGTTVWIKPDDEFWRNGAGVTDAATLATVEGKYLKGAASSSNFSAIANLCKIKTLLATFNKVGTGSGEIRGPVTVVGGQRVVKLSDTTDPAYAYTTDTAPPKLLQIADPRSTGGSITFSYPGTPVTITPPPASQVLAQ